MNLQNRQNHQNCGLQESAAQFLVDVEEALASALQLDLMLGHEEPRVLRDAAEHLCFAGGKRARPRLVYLFGQAVGAPDEALRHAALTAELIHTASLMHDDVVDMGMLRRGRNTVNAQWDNTVAVLGGDMMLTLAFLQLKQYPQALTTSAMSLVSKMTRASMMEVEALGRVDLAPDYWREIALGKTGALFGWCGWAAGFLAGDMDAAERFATCGDHLGVAFQMADDLKDIAGGEPGKDRFVDLRNGNPSFVLFDAIHRSDRLRDRLAEAWQGLPLHREQTESLGALLLAEGAASRTLQALEQEINAALDCLGPYLEQPGTAEIADWINAMFYGLCQELQEAEHAQRIPDNPRRSRPARDT